MPASIIEDSSLLKPVGRVICVILFFSAIAFLFTAMSYVGKGVEFLKSRGAQERVTSIADSIPEEMSFVLPAVRDPKTTEEKLLRTREVENTLNSLTKIAQRKYSNGLSNKKIDLREPKKIIAIGVLEGAVHPKEGKRILEEISLLNITLTPKGQWEAMESNKPQGTQRPNTVKIQ
jgi:hypothetical protein